MYFWLKWMHLLGMVIWVGGLMGVTRLMGKAVRYETVESRRDAYATYKRAHMFVDWGGLFLTLLGGLWLLFAFGGAMGYLHKGYFHMKLTFVAVLILCDIFLSRRLFALDPAEKTSPVFFRVIHGIAGLALMGALLAVFVIRG